MLAVPKKILGVLDIEAGSRVEVSVERGRLIIEPRKKPRYTLAELLSRCRPADLRGKDRAWLAAPPVGKEAL